MPVLNLSFLNPKFRKTGGASTYGVLVDQLSIREDNLAQDGKLSPGDYDTLIGDAKKLYSHPGLTAGQRSNVSVKIANYQRAKNVSKLNDTRDIDRSNRTLNDQFRQANIAVSNDPKSLLKARSFALQQKLENLTDNIEGLSASGDDPTMHQQEFIDTLNRYSDTTKALKDVEGYTGGDPASDFVAFITTNSEGEIVDIDVGRPGARTGFLEVQAVYGGLQVFGKKNAKRNGKNVFRLGNETYSAADILIPTADGSLRSQVLTAESAQMPLGRSSRTKFTGTGFVEVDLTSLRSQGAVRIGGWAEGSEGTLYQRKDNGRYTKYANVDEGFKERFGITDNDILRVPSFLESNILSQVDITNDGAGEFILSPDISSEAPAPTGAGPTGIPLAPTNDPTTFGGGQARTPGPTERAPVTAPGIADRVTQSVKGFFGGLFNR